MNAGAFTITWKNGENYVLRHICESDEASRQRGYEAMSQRAKWFRMFNALPRLSAAQAAKFCSPDPGSEYCLVIEGQGDREGEILRGARIAREAESEWGSFSSRCDPRRKAWA